MKSKINKIIDDHFVLTDSKVKDMICLDELKRVIAEVLDGRERFKDAAWAEHHQVLGEALLKAENDTLSNTDNKIHNAIKYFEAFVEDHSFHDSSIDREYYVAGKEVELQFLDHIILLKSLITK